MLSACVPALKGRGARPAGQSAICRSAASGRFRARRRATTEYLAELDRPPTEYLPDDSQSIVAENDSPDVGFRYSVNPYRGCAHGCSYCYARPYHEYLGFQRRARLRNQGAREVPGAGAAARVPGPAERGGRRRSSSPASPIATSRPSASFELTRRCLEVAAECRQPVGIITKNALVTRDIDLLQQLAEHQRGARLLSITTLDAKLARVMEPRTSSPAARLAHDPRARPTPASRRS